MEPAWNVDAAGNHHKGDKQADEADGDKVVDAVQKQRNTQEFLVRKAEHNKLQHQQHHKERVPVLKGTAYFRGKRLFHLASPPSAAPVVLAARRSWRLRTAARCCISASATTMVIRMMPVMVLS